MSDLDVKAAVEQPPDRFQVGLNSFERMLRPFIFALIFIMAARISIDTDTWWHLRAGEWMLDNHALLRVDVFSYTRVGADWDYPGWLVEIPMTMIYRLLGWGGINLWTAIMVSAAFFFLWYTLEGGFFLRAFTLILAAATSAVYWAARPYLITFLLAAIFLWVLEDYRWRRANRLWILPPLMLIWGNSHGGFAVGFLLWGIYFVGGMQVWSLILHGLRNRAWRRTEPRIDTNEEKEGALLPASSMKFLSGFLRSGWESIDRKLLWIGVFLLVAICFNPGGPTILLYPFKTVSIGVLKDYIQEWQSPDFHQRPVQPFAWMLLLVFGILGASRKRLAGIDFLLLAGFTYMSLLAGRNIALFALVAAPIITRHAQPLLEAGARWLNLRNLSRPFPPAVQRALNIVLYGLLAVGIIAKLSLVFPASANEKAFRETLPVDAVQYLREERPAGRLFNSYNWGGYLLWALTEYPVFVDGRTDLYNDEIIGEWLHVVRADPGWEKILERYGVNVVLIEKGSALERVLGLTPGWNLAYQDEKAVIYQR